MPLLSVVIPTYRRAAMLATALDSMKQQTFDDFEVLVCDNGNEPEVAQLVASYSDARFHYHPRESNLGMLANALQGLRDARGEFVTKLDDDDRFHPHALALLTAPLREHPDVALVFGKLLMVGPNGSFLPLEQAAFRSFAGRDRLRGGYYRPFESLAAHGTVSLAGAIARRSTLDLEDFPIEVDTAYDMFICLSAAADGASAYFVDADVVDYRVHPDSDTNTNLARQLRGQLAVLDLCVDSERYQDRDVFEIVAARAALHLGRVLLRDGEAKEARAVLARANRVVPTLEGLRLMAIAMTPPALGRRVLKRRQAAYLARLQDQPAGA